MVLKQAGRGKKNPTIVPIFAVDSHYWQLVMHESSGYISVVGIYHCILTSLLRLLCICNEHMLCVHASLLIRGVYGFLPWSEASSCECHPLLRNIHPHIMLLEKIYIR